MYRRVIPRGVNARDSSYGLGTGAYLEWIRVSEYECTIRFLAACALLEGLLVHPASHGHIDPAHELIVVNCTTVKFFTAC